MTFADLAGPGDPASCAARVHLGKRQTLRATPGHGAPLGVGGGVGGVLQGTGAQGLVAGHQESVRPGIRGGGSMGISGNMPIFGPSAPGASQVVRGTGRLPSVSVSGAGAARRPGSPRTDSTAPTARAGIGRRGCNRGRRRPRITVRRLGLAVEVDLAVGGRRLEPGATAGRLHPRGDDRVRSPVMARRPGEGLRRTRARGRAVR
jgi:hypothetical protein